MTSTEAAAIYVGLNIALLVILGFLVVGRRVAARVSLGDGGDEKLNLRIRVHGNATEYMPAFLVGLFMSAALGLGVGLVHLLGATFTLGRILHAIGLSNGIAPARSVGMLLTWLPMLGVAGLLIWQGLV